MDFNLAGEPLFAEAGFLLQDVVAHPFAPQNFAAPGHLEPLGRRFTGFELGFRHSRYQSHDHQSYILKQVNNKSLALGQPGFPGRLGNGLGNRLHHAGVKH